MAGFGLISHGGAKIIKTEADVGGMLINDQPFIKPVRFVVPALPVVTNKALGSKGNLNYDHQNYAT